MVYLLFIIINCGYLSLLRKCKKLYLCQIFIFSLPMLLMWCLLIGGQYNVGADYFSYLEMFEPGSDMRYVKEIRGEYAFSWFVETCQNIGIYGQGIFFVIAIIFGAIFLYISFSFVGSKYIYLFLFVFIVFTGGFNNQMNGIRQYFAMYTLWLAIAFFCKKKYMLSAALFIITPFFHFSSIAVMAVLPIFYWVCTWNDRKWLYGILFVSIVCSTLISDEVIDFFIPYFDNYANYLNSELLYNRKPLLIFTKYICFPLFIYAIYLFPKMDLSEQQRHLFVFGLCGYSLKLSLVSMSLVSRLGLYLELFSCIPLVFLLIYLRNRKYKQIYFSTLFYLFFPYFLKVLFVKSGEYSYRFFLVNT